MAQLELKKRNNKNIKSKLFAIVKSMLKNQIVTIY